MGLLDNLYLGHGANFGGQGGGLLDFLRTTQMQQGQYQPSQGFGNPMDANAQMQAAPMDIGGYQMPRIGSAEQFTPDQAAIPQNAQPTQGQMQAPQQPQESPGGFGAGLQGFLRNLHTGPIGAIAGGVGSAMGMQDPAKQQQNQTARFLESRGMDPAMAKTVVSDPVLLRSVLPQIMGMGGQTDDIKEYQFAKKEDPTLTFDKFMSKKKSVTGEFGLTPIWGTGPDGKPAYIQPGKSGEARLAALPKGFEIARDPIKVDAGTHWVLLDPQTRQPVGNVPKDLKGKERAEEIGKAQGVAGAALPAVEMTAKTTIDQIDQFINSKGFNEVFGALDQYRPNITMSDEGRDALTQFKRLSGRAFLEGRSMLKGGGAITDFESNKAESAIARLERSLNEADAKAALEEFKSAVREGAAKLRATSGAAPAATAAPQRIRLNADGTIAQ